MALQFLFQFLSLLLLFTTIRLSATYPGSSTRFDTMRRRMTSKSNSHLPPEFVTYYYTQTLDHFNYKPESYATFQQKYIMNFKYWGGASTSSPIIVYIGEEAPLTFGVHGKGFIFYLASRFKAMLLYIEHRYYGDSMPFGSFDEAFRDANTLGFLSSTQALADCAQLITDVKRNLSAENCPVIAIGGSYGGMLASWLRLKYPHIATGALASSAPILYFDDLTPQNGYHVVVTNDFRDVSESCYNTIKQSWSEIDRVAGQTNELATWFRLKYPHIALGALASSAPVLYYEDITPHNAYYSIVTKNYRDTSETCYQTILKSWAEIQRVGELPDGASILSRQFKTCTPLRNENELRDALAGMYASTSQYGRPPENPIEKFCSAVDRATACGNDGAISYCRVLKNISDNIIALPTVNGSHCLDIVKSNKTSDPDWLVQQRKTEVEIIEGWIAKYYADLKAINKWIPFKLQ
ncbi:hypothetical protein CUMW_237070 [Citrus unshiu]|uniref:Lysosomal Pro-X carboxypeptidase n=1 Tax=Citrus unshiu TaxID=55188 RepID=A0A2H5QJU4_CITUN|nr:hypothetical protein CUMW_237070 [Citrus unshiu]